MMADPFPVQIEGLKRGLSPSTHAHPRPLSDRDLAILLAIDQYRYLDRDHVTDLFFPGRRSAELCLKDLLWRGLIYRWPVVRWQGSPIKPSVYGLTSSGARRVAQLREEPVGFQVVSQVVGLFAGAASAVAYRPWGLPTKLGDSSRSRRTQPVHRGLNR